MNLSDDQILQLTSLCSLLADDQLSTEDRGLLNALLRESDEARQFYLRYSALSTSLFSYAAEMQSEALPSLPKKSQRTMWVSLAMAASVFLFTGAWWMMPENEDLPKTPVQTPSVASVSGTKDCEWSGDGMFVGASLQAGQKLELKKGYAEITFDSGARLTMEGPASLVVASSWEASLETGAVDAMVPAEAEGFRLSNASVELVNTDAELSMMADQTGAEVLVRKGSVAASSNASATPIMLKENDSRRFAISGISEVKEQDRKLARFARLQKMERRIMPGGYAHWTFDDHDNASFQAETKGKKKVSLHVRLVTDDHMALDSTLVEGRWNKALNFDSHLSAKTMVPGLMAQDTSHTVSFWMRVPADASLAGGATMIAWGDKKRSSTHTSIGWNKKPALGSVGALRTEVGRVAASGSINLRDGRWHHIAVVLARESPGVLHAKQYVDGRLDGTCSTVFSVESPVSKEVTDLLFLGRGAGNRNGEGFFVGALDELFAIDRALSPSEVVRLMHDNQPPEIALADLN
ncbi:hypothetical protein BH11VER1_BH11VER1_11600 [soil metagenome]